VSILRGKKMKKKYLIVGLLIIFILSWNGWSQEGTNIWASIDTYSGRAPVSWELTPDEAFQLKARVELLAPKQPEEIETTGYVLVRNPEMNPLLPYYQILIYQDLVILDDGTNRNTYAGGSELLNWVLEAGNVHDPEYVAPKYKTLPPGTPLLAVIPSSLEEILYQEDAKSLVLTVFSEGNAPLQGTLEVPEFVSVDKKSFTLKEINGAEDLIFRVDTASPGVRTGYIVLKSNDPANPELKVPLTITILEKPGAKTVSADTNNNRGMDYLIYFILFAVFFSIAFLLFGKRKKRKIPRLK
jgi:hypothetical protein